MCVCIRYRCVHACMHACMHACNTSRWSPASCRKTGRTSPFLLEKPCLGIQNPIVSGVINPALKGSGFGTTGQTNFNYFCH